MFASWLSVWWHNFVNGLNVEPGTKDFLNDYGLIGIWGAGILFALYVLKRLFGR